MEHEYIRVQNFVLRTIPFDSGSYGQIHFCIDDDNNFYAAKRIPIKKDKIGEIRNNKELIAYSKLKDDHIIKLLASKRTKNYLYLMLEYCDGKNLDQILNNFYDKFNKPFTLEIIQFIANEITKGMVYMCMNNFVHRDLKLQNIMLNQTLETKAFNEKISCICQNKSLSKMSIQKSEAFQMSNDIFKGEDPSYFKAKTIEEFTTEIKKYHVKIIDLGFVNESQDNLFTSYCYSEGYMAPEILNEKYSNKVDLWSFGCVLYHLAFKTLPFKGNPLHYYFNYKYKIPNLKTNIITYEFVDLINGLLRSDFNHRYDWDIVMNHPFLNEDISKQKPISEDIELDAKNSHNYFVNNIELKKRMIDMKGNKVDKNGKIIEKCFYRYDSEGKHHEGILIGEQIEDDWLVITDNGFTTEIVQDKCVLF